MERGFKMNWKIILKNEERWKRYLSHRSKEQKEGRKYKTARKPTQPKFKCAMCGKKLSRIGDTRYETRTNTGLGYCKQCAEHRDRR